MSVAGVWGFGFRSEFGREDLGLHAAPPKQVKDCCGTFSGTSPKTLETNNKAGKGLYP